MVRDWVCFLLLYFFIIIPSLYPRSLDLVIPSLLLVAHPLDVLSVTDALQKAQPCVHDSLPSAPERRVGLKFPSVYCCMSISHMRSPVIYPEGSSRDQGKHQSRRLHKGPLRALPPSVQTASHPDRSAAAHQHRGPRTQAVCHEAAHGRAPPLHPIDSSASSSQSGKRSSGSYSPSSSSEAAGPPFARPASRTCDLAPPLAPSRCAARECSPLLTRSADRRRHRWLARSAPSTGSRRQHRHRVWHGAYILKYSLYSR